MEWYYLFDGGVEKWITLVILVITFGLILYRKFAIAWVSLIAAGILVFLGIANPAHAFMSAVNWDVLAIYWGYGMLAIAFRESKLPPLVVHWMMSRVKKEKYVLLFLCALAMFLSSFVANPVVVIMLAPLAIEIASKYKVRLPLYLFALAISSNVVTTVTMIADPPAIILATTTGMNFLDFYWFQDKISLGTLSIIGLLAALLTLAWQFRKLNDRIDIIPERLQVSYTPLIFFIISVLVLAVVPWYRLEGWNHPGLVGLGLGLIVLVFSGGKKRELLREFDWQTILFLIGIFIVIATVSNVGLLDNFVAWLGGTGLTSPAIYLALIVWVSVLLSSFIDNVPYTILMLPVCEGIAGTLGVSPYPFYFGMLAGTGIGGNLTPVGATANVLACGLLERMGYHVRFREYISVSVPITIVAVLVIYLLLQVIWMG